MLDGVALGLGLFVGGLVAAVLAWPWVSQADDRRPERGAGDAPADRREAVLTALRDLDFDHTLDKIQGEDYVSQRQALLAEAAALLTEEDKATAAGRACPVCSQPTRVDALFCSACGADLSQALPLCSACGWEAEPEDLYCRGCGQRLQTPA